MSAMSTPEGNGPFPLEQHPAHLGTDTSTHPQPAFTGEMAWYMGYGERHGADGPGGRLLAMHTFTESWTSWEVHPLGTEVVLVTAGRVRLHQETEGVATAIELAAGEYAINPPGVWHTADVLEGPATAVFVTCGAGTEHRPR